MPTVREILTLQELLTPFNKLVNELSFESPHDFASLRAYIIDKEMQAARDSLFSLINTPDIPLAEIKVRFKTLSQARDAQNSATSLSFSALPAGETNRLFWAITIHLFSPKNLRELLAILSPNTKKILIPALDTETLPTSLLHSPSWQRIAAWRKIQLDMIEVGIEEEDNDTVLPNTLSNYIFLEDTLFDVREIKKLPFDRQQQFYNACAKKSPSLFEALYNHNTTLKTLRDDICWVNKKGQTARTALTQMEKGLRLGGEGMTGEVYAGKSAVMACGVFNAYLDSLDEAFKVRVLSLKVSTGESLKNVLSALANGDCVETAANQITNILDNPSNQSSLDTHTILNKAQRACIKEKYSRKHQGAFHCAQEDNTRLPETIASKVLSEIKIVTAEALVVLLLNFPPHLFETLLSRVRIIGNKRNKKRILGGFLEAIMHHFFNNEQLKDLLPALGKHIQRFVSKKKALFIVVKSGNASLLRGFIEGIREKERISIFKAKDEYSSTVLHLVAKNPESLRMILALYPIDERLKAVKKKDADYASVMYFACRNPESLKIILALYPIDERLKAIKKQNRNDRTVLEITAYNPKCLNVVLASLPDIARFKALKSKIDGSTLWKRILKKPQTEINQIQDGIESPLLHLLVDFNSANNALSHTVPHFFSPSADIHEELPSLDALFSLTSPDKAYEYVINCLSEESDAKRVLLNTLVSRQKGDVSKPYSENAAFLKESWLSLGLLKEEPTRADASKLSQREFLWKRSLF